MKKAQPFGCAFCYRRYQVKSCLFEKDALYD